MPAPVIQPMLAINRAPDSAHRWAIEPKADGWRCIITIDGRPCIRTRSGRVVTDALPELSDLANQVPDGTVLDGELVADAGRATDFYKVAPQMMRRRRAAPLVYALFDIPILAGHDITALPYLERRRLLEDLDLTGPSWCTLPSFEADVGDVLTHCERLQLEGLVVKRVDSRYEPGRRSIHWRKIKCDSWREHHADLRRGH